MKLKKLLKSISVNEVKGSKEIEITGITSNSKSVSPGNLFIAKRGKTNDGTQFIPDAIAAGAAAILSDIYDPFLEEVTQLVDGNITGLESQLAATFYQQPSHKLFTVGITGTCGKTTTAYLVKQLLDPGCGLIGSIEYIVGSSSYSATHTTPDVCTNHKMLHEMVRNGCTSAVMEVTSHALDQGRVAEIAYDVAVFTNLSQEHLDYHPSMQAYAEAKQQLFTGLTEKATAIFNKDDPWSKMMASQCKAHQFTYGLTQEADLSLTEGKITFKGEQVPFTPPLVGRYNLYNCLAAIAVGISYGMSLESAARKLEKAIPVPGRLEPVPNDCGLSLFVDFAHKPDALEKVLQSLKESATGRLITIFGCGGDRDTLKRPLMAAAAERYSDFVIVTSDNPRSEDPLTICDEIIQGFTGAEFSVQPDRYQAIAYAIENASPGDTILIAGKGHETHQIFRHKTIDFDDRKVAAEICTTKKESVLL